MKISFYSDKLRKCPIKWPTFGKKPNVFFHGQRTSKKAKVFEMANLATLCDMLMLIRPVLPLGSFLLTSDCCLFQHQIFRHQKFLWKHQIWCQNIKSGNTGHWTSDWHLESLSDNFRYRNKTNMLFLSWSKSLQK